MRFTSPTRVRYNDGDMEIRKDDNFENLLMDA